MNVLIVGAGISGLLLAKEIKNCGVKVEIWEKSSGIGGRMATRRGSCNSWDHGAQFYSPDGLLQKYHQSWLEQNLLKPWPFATANSQYYGVQGMSSLAKNLATNVQIYKNRRLCKLVKNSSHWTAEDESGNFCNFSDVFITCPLPQSILLLEQNCLDFPGSWKNIIYSKAIVALVFSKSTLPEIPFYQENPDDFVSSWADMKAKGLSDFPSWTVTASPNWSEKHWQESEKIILEKFMGKILDFFSLTKFPESEWQIKKWLYSKPLGILNPDEGIISKKPVLVITGDAFGEGSIAGAAKAAKSAFLNWQKLTMSR